jgi:hypothetical protein
MAKNWVQKKDLQKYHEISTESNREIEALLTYINYTIPRFEHSHLPDWQTSATREQGQAA